mgnify:CR=1 FL=1
MRFTRRIHIGYHMADAPPRSKSAVGDSSNEEIVARYATEILEKYTAEVHSHAEEVGK